MEKVLRLWRMDRFIKVNGIMDICQGKEDSSQKKIMCKTKREIERDIYKYNN